MMQELIENACKYSVSGTPIEIDGYYENQFYVISVKTLEKVCQFRMYTNFLPPIQIITEKKTD